MTAAPWTQVMSSSSQGMMSRWGSCSNRGAVTMSKSVSSWGLLQASIGLLLLNLVTTYGLLPTQSVMKEYCWPQSFNVSCSGRSVIMMESARYGRMRKGRCLTSDIHVGCALDVLAEVDRRCSGRQSCYISIPDTILHRLQPCPKDLLAYLEARFSCILVERPLKFPCLTSYINTSQHPVGYISNVPAKEVPPEPTRCPWVIRAQNGQRVNITLYDFSVAIGRQTDNGVCLVYAIIKEEDTQTEVTICRGSQRVRNVFTSETPSVEVLIITDASGNYDSEGEGQFMLKYEAVGCADPLVPKGASYKRDKDKVSVHCNQSAETWFLYCSGNNWIGPWRNCTQILPRTAGNTGDGTGSSFPYGLVTAIIIGIIFGIVLGIILLTVILVWEKRKRRARDTVKMDGPDACTETTSLPGNISRISSDEMNKLQRMGNYGYAHVWELRSLKSIAEDGSSVNKTPVSTRTSSDIPTCCGEHAYRGMYDSPPGSQPPHHSGHHMGMMCECPMYSTEGLEAALEGADNLQNSTFSDVDILQQSDNRCSM